MNQIERSRRRFNHTAIKNTADVSSKRDKNRIVYIERERQITSQTIKNVCFISCVLGKQSLSIAPAYFTPKY